MPQSWTLGKPAALVKCYADKLDEQIGLIEWKYGDDIAGAMDAKKEKEKERALWEAVVTQ